MASAAWVGKNIPNRPRFPHKRTTFQKETALVDEESIIKCRGLHIHGLLSTDLVLAGLHASATLAFSIVDSEIKSQDRSSDDVEIGSKISILTRTPSCIRKLVSFPSNWTKSERAVETSGRFMHCLWSQGLG